MDFIAIKSAMDLCASFKRAIDVPNTKKRFIQLSFIEVAIRLGWEKRKSSKNCGKSSSTSVFLLFKYFLNSSEI